VGERLRRAREAARLSQRRLAFSGCSPAYISRIEAGDRIPSLQLLRELGRRLGVSEDYLATGAERNPVRAATKLVEAEVALRLDELDVAESLYSTLADGDGSDDERGQALAGLGQLAFRRGDPRRAIEFFERAISLYGLDELDHPAAADSLGRAYAMVGELEASVGVFERCRQGAEEREDRVETIRFSVLLGNALIDSGSFGKAEELIGHTLASARELRDPFVLARVYWLQSRLHLERRDADIAARYARKALDILELTEHTHYIARAHQLLAHIELDRGRPQEALELLEEGWPLLARSGNAVEQAQFRLEEARALARLGQQEEAAALAMELSSLLVDADPFDAGRIYGLLGDIFVDFGERNRARELYELAAELLQRNHPNRYLIDVYAKLADLLEGDGEREAAYALMKRAIGVQQEIASQTRA
jgi:tetratricopeptide (TPR) repeat protein